MVLNSVTWDTELISIDGVLTKTTIGGVHGRVHGAHGGHARPGGAPTGYALAWIKDRDVRIGSIDEEGRALDRSRRARATRSSTKTAATRCTR
jgi:hypothetical protein